MKVTKVKAHLKKTKKSGAKKVRQHVRKTKTAADKIGAGEDIKSKGKTKNPGAKPPQAMPGKGTFKSEMHQRMAALRAMRGKKKAK